MITVELYTRLGLCGGGGGGVTSNASSFPKVVSIRKSVAGGGPKLKQNCFSVSSVLAWYLYTDSSLIIIIGLCARDAIPSKRKAFVQCWTNVEDVGPTLYKCYMNVLCLLG